MSKRLLVEQKHTKAGIEFIKEGLEEFGIEKKQTIKNAFSRGCIGEIKGACQRP